MFYYIHLAYHHKTRKGHEERLSDLEEMDWFMQKFPEEGMALGYVHQKYLNVKDVNKLVESGDVCDVGFAWLVESEVGIFFAQSRGAIGRTK